MPPSELLRRIEERLAAMPMSERRAVTLAGVGADFIRDLRRRGYSPKAEKLARLARVLEVPLSFLTDAVTQDGGHSPPGVVELVEQPAPTIEHRVTVGENPPRPGDPIQDLDEAALIGEWRKMSLIKKATLLDFLGFTEMPSMQKMR